MIAGLVVKCWMFVMRLSHSGKAFHVTFATQAQEAFLEGHVLAFEYFGGVPGRIRYDNLKPTVIRVLKGRDRTESERFTALRSHYGFDSFFCRPGIDGAHEKGGVEGEVGRFRRRHLVPVPRVASLAELNELIAAGDVVDDERHIARRADTVGQAAAAHAGGCRPPPHPPVVPLAGPGRKVGAGPASGAWGGVLCWHRGTPARVVIGGRPAALAIGRVDPDIVPSEPRRTAARRPPAPVVPIGTGARVVRPGPRLDGY